MRKVLENRALTRNKSTLFLVRALKILTFLINALKIDCILLKTANSLTNNEKTTQNQASNEEQITFIPR